ncbi:hypothetical protein Droror1_Dr00023971 [Drosera rotundifolia]
MIKRRFYRLEHAERDGDADSQSSSSSESETESESESGVLAKCSDEDSDAVGNEEEDESDRGEQTLPRVPLPELSSSSSGYESEDSSGDELDPESNSADEEGIGKKLDGKKIIVTNLASNGSHEIARTEPKTPLPDNLSRCVLKHKSVLKCKICPKIVCLNEDSLRTHLESKRHSRSEKLLNDGRLKRILNNNGEEIFLEEDGETHAERYARTLASTQQDQPKKKVGGRQRQKERRKRKGINNSNEEAPKQGRESLPKKRHKNI